MTSKVYLLLYVIAGNGASVVTRGTLAKGLLTNSWVNRLKPYEPYSQKEVHQLLAQLAEHYDIHALALAFNLHFEVIASTVIGASSKEQLLQSVQAYEKAQSIDVKKALDMVQQHHYTDHR